MGAGGPVDNIRKPGQSPLFQSGGTMDRRFKTDDGPMETKKPGSEGYLIFNYYNQTRVIVTEWFTEDEMPDWAIEANDFEPNDLLWLRKVDGTPFEHEDSESILRDNNKECAFHHRWFTKAGDWDKETN